MVAPGYENGKYNAAKGVISLEIDLRGLSCPTPVLKVKEALEGSDEKVFCVLVDRGAPFDNVTRLAVKKGCKVESKQLDDGIELKITRT